MKVEFDHVSFGYSSDKQILHNINLTLDGPGLICIIGPNGVGKSTMVKCINKLLKPTEGTVRIDDVDVSGMSNADVAEKISYVPAMGSDCFSMPVIDAILVGRHNKQKWKTTDKDLRIVYKAMKMLNIEDLAMHGYNELSAGQLQRVAIARGLVQRPKVLVLDEPTANLDVRYQVYLTELLRAVAECCNITVMMISHDLNISAKYGHEIIMMAPPGIIHMVGEPAEVIIQENIETIYGVHCRIIRDEEFDSPLVILGRSHLGEGERPA